MYISLLLKSLIESIAWIHTISTTYDANNERKYCRSIHCNDFQHENKLKTLKHFPASSCMTFINNFADPKISILMNNNIFFLQENKKRSEENSLKCWYEAVFQTYMQKDQKINHKWTEKGSVTGLAESVWGRMKTKMKMKKSLYQHQSTGDPILECLPMSK